VDDIALAEHIGGQVVSRTRRELELVVQGKPGCDVSVSLRDRYKTTNTLRYPLSMQILQLQLTMGIA
jgi:hypothetical protein